MIFYPEVWLSLAFLYFVGEALSRRYSVAISFSIFGLISLAAYVSLFSVTVGQAPLALTVLVISTICLIASIFFLRRSLTKPLWLAVRSMVFGAFSAAVSIITQYFGVAGVAFSDGFTILTATSWIQGAFDISPLDGNKGVKRGFAISAVQSLGETGEYVVGFIPLIFIAAVSTSLLIVFRIIGDKKKSVLVSLVLLAMMLSTEAIFRHLYLMNSHSLIWLAFAITILMIIDNHGFVFKRTLIVSLIPLLSALAFARLDAIWIYAPLLVPIALANYRASKINGLLVLSPVLISLGAWLFLAVVDFPFGGKAGVGIILTLAASAFLLANWLLPETALTAASLRKIYYFASLGLLLVIIIISNRGISVKNLVVNLFLGEGLWGVTIVALLVFSLLAIPLLRRVNSDQIVKFLLAAGLLAMSLYLFAKVADGLGSGAFTGYGFSRIGWGDSLNRMLVAYIPFAVVFVSSALSFGANTKVEHKFR